MRQEPSIRCVICGEEATKVETKLDGAKTGYCSRHAMQGRATLHDVLRRIRLKQTARKYLRKRL